MSRMRRRVPASLRVPLTAALVAGLLTGCASWKPGWSDLPDSLPPGGGAAALSRGQKLFAKADNRAGLAAAIDAYEAGLRQAPQSYPLLTALCEAYVLDSAAYAESKKEKKQQYRTGIAYCERALYTNDEFRRRIEEETPAEQALQALTLAEADAMLFWVTGISYYFKECMGGLARIRSYRLIRRSETMLAHLNGLEPDYADGAVYFSRGIYYLALPKIAGGDRVLSAQLLTKAREVAPDSLLIPWGRAKYYHFETGNRTAFEEDLRWVLEQDPHAGTNPYAWNVYFQRDAQQLLDDVDRLF
jgi:tetratricopeptide (TPR) repeat protein